MTWNTQPFIAFDLETTGPDPETARIVSASVIKFLDRNRFVDGWLVNPGVPIPPEATAVHGITDEQASSGTPIDQALREIVKAIEDGDNYRETKGKPIPLVAYNAAYDLTVLHRELLRSGRAHFAKSFLNGIGPVIDPRVIDKEKDRYRRGKRTLGDVCAHYGVELTDAHSAAADAMAAGNVALALAEKYPELTKVDTAYLHERQAAWYAEQAQGLAQYWRDLALSADETDAQDLRERADSINTHWPIIPVGDSRE